MVAVDDVRKLSQPSPTGSSGGAGTSPVAAHAAIKISNCQNPNCLPSGDVFVLMPPLEK